jgi:hypothetical protein
MKMPSKLSHLFIVLVIALPFTSALHAADPGKSDDSNPQSPTHESFKYE